MHGRTDKHAHKRELVRATGCNEKRSRFVAVAYMAYLSCRGRLEQSMALLLENLILLLVWVVFEYACT